MVELRRDRLSGTPVVSVPARQGRPNLPVESCPFCPGGLEAQEPYELKAFPNRWPSLGPERCEVVLFSPEHDRSLGDLPSAQLEAIIELWRERTEVMLSLPGVSDVLVFENRGAAAGATIPHPHGQIYAFPETPPVIATELAAEGACELCADHPHVVVEEEHWSAWAPEASSWPFELRLAPKHHHSSLTSEEHVAGMARVLGESLIRLDQLFDAPMPYMLWIHQFNQEHPRAHLHLHVAPVYRSSGTPRFVAAGEVGSGVMFNPIDPAQAAERLRALPGRSALDLG